MSVKLASTPLCPSCSNPLDGAESAVEETNRFPTGGDLSVCMYCAALLVFDHDLALRLLSFDEILQLTREEARLLQNVQRASRELRAKRSH